MVENGPTRREFDQLHRELDRLRGKLDHITTHGTTHGAVLESKVQGLTDALNGLGIRVGEEIRGVRTEIQEFRREVDQDLKDVGGSVDKKLSGFTKFGWTVLGFFVLTLIGVVATLIVEVGRG